MQIELSEKTVTSIAHHVCKFANGKCVCRDQGKICETIKTLCRHITWLMLDDLSANYQRKPQRKKKSTKGAEAHEG